MPSSMRVVNTAAHFGACLAEEAIPAQPSATIPGCCFASTDHVLAPSSAIQHGCRSVRRQRARGAREDTTQTHNARMNATSRGASVVRFTQHPLWRFAKRLAGDAASAKERRS